MLRTASDEKTWEPENRRLHNRKTGSSMSSELRTGKWKETYAKAIDRDW
jgi:hypothetical protein